MPAGADQDFVTVGSLVIGYAEVSGVDFSLEVLDGWGSPGSTIEVVQKPRADGGWAGSAFLRPRNLSLGGKIFAPNPAALTDAIDRLGNAFSLDDTTLSVSEAGRVRSVTVRRTDEVMVRKITSTIALWSAQVIAKDPRKFAAALSGFTFLPSSSGGLTVPFTVPFAINSTVVAGNVSLTNPGNEAGPVVLRIDGPTTGPVITHVGSGQALVFSSSLVLNTGEWLTVDMDKRTALANDQASRSGYITGRGWSAFEPGSNTWSFTAAGFNALSKLTVTATPSWK